MPYRKQLLFLALTAFKKMFSLLSFSDHQGIFRVFSLILSLQLFEMLSFIILLMVIPCIITSSITPTTRMPASLHQSPKDPITLSQFFDQVLLFDCLLLLPYCVFLDPIHERDHSLHFAFLWASLSMITPIFDIYVRSHHSEFPLPESAECEQTFLAVNSFCYLIQPSL